VGWIVKTMTRSRTRETRWEKIQEVPISSPLLVTNGLCNSTQSDDG